MSARARVGNWLAHLLAPYIRRMAEVAGVRLNYHAEPTGEHPLIIEGGAEQIRHWIPPTVLFNTRSGAIHVGRDTVFGENVQVLTGKHLAIWEAETSGLPLHHVPAEGRDIRIGRGCYIGSAAILIGPLNVGDHAVIGAGSVVTHDVPPRTFCAGVPARVIRSHQLGAGEDTV